MRQLGLWGICLALGACQSGPDVWADLVVLHANVITVDSTRPRAEAFAVLADKFIAVGSTSQIRRWVGESTKVIDAEGRTITPGFIDAHMHPRPTYPEASPLATVDLRPASVASMADLIDALAAKAAGRASGFAASVMRTPSSDDTLLEPIWIKPPPVTPSTSPTRVVTSGLRTPS